MLVRVEFASLPSVLVTPELKAALTGIEFPASEPLRPDMPVFIKFTSYDKNFVQLMRNFIFKINEADTSELIEWNNPKTVYSFTVWGIENVLHILNKLWGRELEATESKRQGFVLTKNDFLKVTEFYNSVAELKKQIKHTQTKLGLNYPDQLRALLDGEAPHAPKEDKSIKTTQAGAKLDQAMSNIRKWETENLHDKLCNASDLIGQAVCLDKQFVDRTIAQLFLDNRIFDLMTLITSPAVQRSPGFFSCMLLAKFYETGHLGWRKNDILATGLYFMASEDTSQPAAIRKSAQQCAQNCIKENSMTMTLERETQTDLLKRLNKYANVNCCFAFWQNMSTNEAMQVIERIPLVEKALSDKDNIQLLALDAQPKPEDSEAETDTWKTVVTEHARLHLKNCDAVLINLLRQALENPKQGAVEMDELTEPVIMSLTASS